MPATWRTVRVFISSTFRDMQAERDHLVRFVFPRLREELLRRRMHFIDVDLRWGVTSEQDAQQVCREIIDECRPRFLCMLGGRYGWTPPGCDRSITADEVHYAALDQGQPDRHHFFYFRDPAATAAMVEQHPGQYREPPGSENERRLEALKQAIQGAGHEPFVYPAQWNAEQGRLVGLEEFGRRVYDDLLASINEELGTERPERVDEFAEEMTRQEAFVSERTARYVVGSRRAVLDSLAEFASTDGEPSILAVTGAPGCGKSALLGRAYQDLTAAHPDWLVVPHFVGVSAGSTDLRRSLRRLCHELQRAAGDGEPLPDDVEQLITRLPAVLEQAGSTRRMVLIIDALNQMDPTDGAHTLRWLAHRLPQNVRIVVSSLAHPVLEALRLRREQVLELELAPLTSADARTIVEGFAARYHKRLSDEQLEALLAKPQSGSPLYLLVALEELRTLGTYEEITARIEQLPGRVQELFLWILQERLSVDPGFQDAQGNLAGAELVRKCVSHLGVSRHGLSHAELVGTVDAGDPRGNVAALERLLRPYLMRRGELLDFYHGQLREAVEAEYLDEEHERLEAHRSIASYFSRQGYANLRTLAELPYHQTQAGLWDELEGTLRDLPFLEGKVTAAMVFELAGDFAAAVAALPDDRPQCRILRLLEDALRRDIHFIARHVNDYPQALFQCMWNTSWWYDCPEAAGHYVEPEGVWTAENARWLQPGETELSRLLERWRESKQQACPGFAWLRSRRPPPVHLGSTQLAVLRGHEDKVFSVSFSPDSCRAVSGSADGTVRIWDVATGEELLCLRGHQKAVIGVSFSPDGLRIVSGSADRTVKLWDVATGVELICLRSHQDEVNVVSFSPDGRLIASGSDDKTVRILDAMNGAELRCLRGHVGAVRAVAWSRDGRRLLSGSCNHEWDFEDLSVHIWDPDTGGQLHFHEGRDDWIREVSFSADGRAYYASCDEERITVFDVDRGSGQAMRGGHDPWVMCASFSTDCRELVTGGQDHAVRLWDTTSGSELDCLHGHDDDVLCVALSSDGNYVLSGSADKTIRVWRRSRHTMNRTLQGHVVKDGSITSVSLSPSGGQAVTCAARHSICFWEVENGILVNKTSHEGYREYQRSPEKTWRKYRWRRPPCLSAAFSPDGRMVVSRSDRLRRVQIWDGAGVSLRHLEVAEPYVISARFSPDSRRLVTGTRNGTVQIWNADTGKEIGRLPGSVSGFAGAAFASNGNIMTRSSGGEMQIWDATTQERLEIAHQIDHIPMSFGAVENAPWRVRVDPSETVVERVQGAAPVASFPVAFRKIAAHPNGRTWAGTSANDLYIITLEGDPLAPPPEPPEQE
ncbi:MAG TPA: DUF4062 domain-containing protein [Thermoguttaceae bacterium]|nr:DUF4062 domain-containing protein [Thermoguttaceae bacterium]